MTFSYILSSASFKKPNQLERVEEITSDVIFTCIKNKYHLRNNVFEMKENSPEENLFNNLCRATEKFYLHVEQTIRNDPKAFKALRPKVNKKLDPTIKRVLGQKQTSKKNDHIQSQSYPKRLKK